MIDSIPPLPMTYWVVPGRFLAGPQPLVIQLSSPHETIETIVSAGINAFIDLTYPAEMMGHTYLPILEKMTDHPDIRYFNLPIRDFGLPTHEVMRDIQDRIKLMLDQNSNIYLHCYGGIGRTGTVVGCYLVEQGMTGEQALEQIKFLRKDFGRMYMPSPETRSQVEFVLNWKKPG
jgi:hypothetical protein